MNVKYDILDNARGRLSQNQNWLCIITGDTGCILRDTEILLDKEIKISISDLKDSVTSLLSYNFNNKTIENDIGRVFDTGKKDVFEIVLENGKTAVVTEDHKFFITKKDGSIEEKCVKDLNIGDSICLSD